MIDEANLANRLEQRSLMSDLRTENLELQKAMLRMKSMGVWKLNSLQSRRRTEASSVTA